MITGTKLWVVVIVAVVAALACLAAYTLAPALFGHSLVPEYRALPVHSGEIVSWQKGAPTPNGTLARTFTDGPDLFLKLGISAGSATGGASDKVTSHSYSTVYGLFLLPLLARAKLTNAKIKLLEVGLGCDMAYGPGHSLSLWRTVLGAHVDIWEAEYDAACVKKAKENGQLAGISALTGDQGDKKQLYKWVEESGGNFDIIIDDGGHRNAQIKTTFDVLFHKALKPGGLYVIEDLQVGRQRPFVDDSGLVMSDVIQSWIEQLLINKEFAQRKHPIPPRIKWILCQQEACVIARCLDDDRAACS